MVAPSVARRPNAEEPEARAFTTSGLHSVQHGGTANPLSDAYIIPSCEYGDLGRNN